VTLGAWWSGHGTNRLIRQVPGDTQQPLNAIEDRAHERHQQAMRATIPDQLASPHNYMQEAS
jgi:hypothetical protein